MDVKKVYQVTATPVWYRGNPPLQVFQIFLHGPIGTYGKEKNTFCISTGLYGGIWLFRTPVWGVSYQNVIIHDIVQSSFIF